MIATVQNVLDDARAHLGDDAISGGQVFTNTVLLPYFGISYRELVRVFQGIQIPRIRNEAYFNLPANTGKLFPSTAGIADMGDPELVEERTVDAEYAVSGATITLSVPTLVTAAHTLTTGARVVVFGLVGIEGANGAWAVTIPDTTHVTLNGAVATGSYTSGGKVSTSGEAFVPLDWVARIFEAEGTGGSTLGKFSWNGDAFEFPSCSTARQLRIAYWSSATAPTGVSSSIGIDDAQDYLSLRTAALAGSARGMSNRANELNALAIGPKQTEADGSGGVLRQLLLSAVLAYQGQRPIRPRPFREPRSIIPEIY